jgi:hypothetical protein
MHCAVFAACVCSAFESTMEALQTATVRVVAVIAEGVPEKDTKRMIAYAKANGKVIIGPATVGGVQVGHTDCQVAVGCWVYTCAHHLCQHTVVWVMPGNTLTLLAWHYGNLLKVRHVSCDAHALLATGDIVDLRRHVSCDAHAVLSPGDQVETAALVMCSSSTVGNMRRGMICVSCDAHAGRRLQDR